MMGFNWVAYVVRQRKHRDKQLQLQCLSLHTYLQNTGVSGLHKRQVCSTSTIVTLNFLGQDMALISVLILGDGLDILNERVNSRIPDVKIDLWPMKLQHIK